MAKAKNRQSGMTPELARELFNYDPTTGALTWRSIPSPRKAKVGDEVGYVCQGYRRVNLLGQKYLVHRVVWLYVHGRWPEAMLDHANRDTQDNRLENLREANHSTNGVNCARTRASGLPRGVQKAGRLGRRWAAAIRVNKQKLYIGCFETPELAAEAYRKAAVEAFGEFARFD